MPLTGPRPLSVLVACAVLLAVAAALPAPSLRRSLDLAASSLSRGYAVVPWANQSVKVLDSRTIWLPPLLGFTGPGLLLSNDPYAVSPAAVAVISSPAPNGGIADYDYAAGATRNLTFPGTISGAGWPGSVTPFVRNGQTFLLSLAPLGTGVSGPTVSYRGSDAQIVAAGILDYPGFVHFVPVNLSIPLTTLGFAYNESVYLAFSAVPDGANLTAIVEVSAYTGGGFFVTPKPPWAKYVYTVNLAAASWVDGSPVVLRPRATLAWSVPVDPGFQMFLTSSEMMVITQNPGGPARNVQFVNVDRGTWWNASLPGRTVEWHGYVGPHLYLLENNWQNASNDEYVMNRIDLDASGAATEASVAWDRLVPRPTTTYGDVAVVTGGRVDFFVGTNGYVNYAAPSLASIYSYDLVCGSLLSVTNVTLTLPLLNGILTSLAYPSLGDVGLFNGFVADTRDGIVYPLDLSQIAEAAAASRGSSLCTSCTYAVYVTKNTFPRMDLLLEEQRQTDIIQSSHVTNLTAVELTASGPMPPPLPYVLVTCPGGTATTGTSEVPLAVLLMITAFAIGGAVIIVATVRLAWRRPPEKRPEDPRPPP